MMDDSKMVNEDSTCDESSKQLEGTVYVDHLAQQILDVNCIVGSNTSTANSCHASPSTKEEIMDTGYPSYENIFERIGYVGSFYPKRGVASWVFECLTRDQINVICNHNRDIPKGGEFYEDKKIDFEKIVALKDYKDSGYDRGHLAAAGNHTYNSLAYDSTFWIGNTAPMGKKVNDILSKIERQGRNLARDKEKLYCITGSVFYPERKANFMKDDSQIQVPHAYFKVLVHEDMGKKFKYYTVYAYMIANESDNNETIQNIYKDIKNARTSLATINMVTGLNILNKVDERLIFDGYPKEGKSRGIGS